MICAATYEDYTHYLFPYEAMGKMTAKVLSKQILTDTQAVIAPSAYAEK